MDVNTLMAFVDEDFLSEEAMMILELDKIIGRKDGPGMDQPFNYETANAWMMALEAALKHGVGTMDMGAGRDPETGQVKFILGLRSPTGLWPMAIFAEHFVTDRLIPLGADDMRAEVDAFHARMREAAARAKGPTHGAPEGEQ